MFKTLFKNKLWLFFLITVALILPFTIALPAQIEKRSVIIAMGIDRSEEGGYEISLEAVIPHFDTAFSQNTEVISCKGLNVSDALEKMSIHVGKIYGLSHCGAIVFGREACDQNITELLDIFIRSRRLKHNTILIATEGKAKDILKASIKVENGLNVSLDDLLQFNSSFFISSYVDMNNFLSTYYQGYGANFMPIVNMSDNDSDGIPIENQKSSDSGNSSGGSQSMSDGYGSIMGLGGASSGAQQNSGATGKQQSQQILSNDGKTAVFNKGRLVRILSNDEIGCFAVFNESDKLGIITIDGVSDAIYNNAQIALSVRERHVSKSLSFSPSGIPRVNYKISYHLRIEEILQEDADQTLLHVTRNYVTPAVTQKFKEKIMQKCATAVNLSKEMNVDLLKIYRSFYRFKYNKWKEYIDGLDDVQDYIQNVEFFADITVHGID